MSDTEELGNDFDDDANAFFSNLTGETPEEPKEAPEETPEAEGFEATTAPEESPEAPTEPDPDDTELEWGEGETKSKASLKALKASYALQAESTRLSTEAATARAQAVSQAAQASTTLTALIAKASAKWEPFAKLDFLALSKDPSISSEDFTALRAAAQEALNDYRYLTTEQEGAAKTQAEAAHAAKSVAVQACIKELTAPNGIPGFGKELYGQLVDHAVSTYGAPKDVVLDITAPWAVRVLNDAMLYRKSLQTAEAKVVKVVNKATKVLRPGGATNTENQSRAQVMKNLRQSGSQEDAEAAFMVSFGG